MPCDAPVTMIVPLVAMSISLIEPELVWLHTGVCASPVPLAAAERVSLSRAAATALDLFALITAASINTRLLTALTTGRRNAGSVQVRRAFDVRQISRRNH